MQDPQWQMRLRNSYGPLGRKSRTLKNLLWTLSRPAGQEDAARSLDSADNSVGTVRLQAGGGAWGQQHVTQLHLAGSGEGPVLD